jgi:hypothetical protein
MGLLDLDYEHDKLLSSVHACVCVCVYAYETLAATRLRTDYDKYGKTCVNG